MSTAAALAFVSLAAVAGPSVPSAGASSAAGHGSDAAVLRHQLHALVAAGVPGAVLVVRDGNRQLRLSAGTSEVGTGTPMQAENRFKIGSITKTFVATVVLDLVRDGRLHLDDTVARWLPGLVPDGAHITIKQLLRHQSGLFDYFDDPRATEPYLAGDLGYVWAPRALIELATSHPPNFPPGTAFSYSNTNYLVLGLIVQRATGHSLRQELRRRIFKPLHLNSTRFPTSQRFGPRLAHGYLWSSGSRQDVTAVSQSLGWAAGGVVSSAGDVVRFYRALLGGRILPQRLLREMRQTVPLGPGVGYGLGLIRVASPCGPLWGHDGSFAGYLSDTLSSAGGRHQMVLLFNQNTFDDTAGTPAAQRAATRLIQTAACARL
ncbi:MAG TPA: serine hydrolase domain-containing protein [Gaiellales bacterium]|jgi:D-alanyl-D-alanine carboxypeptidase|nr:serine hydrolase domain-containing protein [Gaiellales bacterium]